ncbi:MAG: hypothetical protein ACTSPQ_20320 [Candidatus Helarchaeota archaeon]
MNRSQLINVIFYRLKPIIPRPVQIWLRRQIILLKRRKYANIWPIDKNSCIPPENWLGWPENKQFAFVITHDVESKEGHDKCLKLMKIEQNLGFCSSFNFVPERYDVSLELRKTLIQNGFEVGVHGLNHDGKLFQSREIFRKRAQKINKYLKEWNAVGFRSPAMHHNLEWIHDLDIEYDLSTFDTDPFEPQSEGVGTIFPFWVKGNTGKNRYLELPYTLPQDFTLFILMKEKTIDIWKKKLDWIVKMGGLVLINTHPDYIDFNNKSIKSNKYPVQYYIQLLEYIKITYSNNFWHIIPKELVYYYKKSSFIESKLKNEKN